MKDNGISSGSLGFGGLLTILFIGLKLTDYIQWSWWWVPVPLWLPLAVVLTLVVVGLGCLGLLNRMNS